MLLRDIVCKAFVFSCLIFFCVCEILREKLDLVEMLHKRVNCYLLEYVSAIETCQIAFTKKKVFSYITHLLPRVNFTEKLENLSLYP